MAEITKTINIDVQSKQAEAEVKRIDSQLRSIDKDAGKATKGVGSVTKSFKGLGVAIKAAGIGLVIAAFAKLTEIFQKNQKVTDAFNIAFESLSIAFNDFVNFIINNGGKVVEFFKAIFENPLDSVKALGASIKANIIERFESFLDTLGFLASAVKKVFSGDFKGALEDVKAAGKESIDVFTGINNTVDRTTEFVTKTAKAVKSYATETFNAAKANVELNTAAEKGLALNRLLLEQFDRQAELQRQIRDDESKTIEERIAANERLGEVLAEQEKLMLANANASVLAAEAQFNKLSNDENEIALLEAKAEREGVLAQITGLRSEQLANINALERERVDLLAQNLEREIEIEEKRRASREETFNTAVQIAGAESKLGKAILLAKQLIQAKEFIMDAKAQIKKAKNAVANASIKAAESGVEVQGSVAKAANVAPPPFNIPFIISAIATGVSIISAVKAAVSSTKKAAASAGGGGGDTPISTQTAAPSIPPSFNIVGASDTNQLADAIGGQTQQPVQAFVVANDVTTAQSLENNIVEGATLG